MGAPTLSLQPKGPHGAAPGPHPQHPSGEVFWGRRAFLSEPKGMRMDSTIQSRAWSQHLPTNTPQNHYKPVKQARGSGCFGVQQGLAANSLFFWGGERGRFVLPALAAAGGGEEAPRKLQMAVLCRFGDCRLFGEEEIIACQAT